MSVSAIFGLASFSCAWVGGLEVLLAAVGGRSANPSWRLLAAFALALGGIAVILEIDR